MICRIHLTPLFPSVPEGIPPLVLVALLLELMRLTGEAERRCRSGPVPYCWVKKTIHIAEKNKVYFFTISGLYGMKRVLCAFSSAFELYGN